MSDTGWKSPGSTSASVWSNPNNIKTDDSNYAQSAEVVAYDGFAIRLTSDGGIGHFIGKEYTSDKEGDTAGASTFVTLGNSTDKWGRTWGVSDFSNENFAIVIKPIDTDSSSPNLYLFGGEFSFDIPTGATIDGIEVGTKIDSVAGSVLNVLRCYYAEAKVHYTESTGTPTVGVKYPLPAFKRP